MHWTDIPAAIFSVFRDGAVIPAHPLALDADRQFDQRRQRALTRYYIDAGSGGLAVGVHTTQFAIREVGLYRPGARTRRRDRSGVDRPPADDDRRRRRAHGAGAWTRRGRRARSAITRCC